MLNERKLTKTELDKREEVIMNMKKNKRALVKKYGKDAEAVMYGRATNIAKNKTENMDQNKVREMIKDALKNPKKADLNKDGKLSDYEEKRGAAIEKSIGKQDLKEFGSSDMNALLSSMHINLGYPKKFPGFSELMDAAEDATGFYMDDFEEYSTNRNELIMSNARAYARREFPEFMAMAANFYEPVDEAIDANDPVLMKMRAAKMRADNAGDDGNDKFFDNAKKIAFLKKEREQLMRDMEQEAEPEGGPIADEYGAKLNRIDAAIAKLKGRKEMTYDQAIQMNENKSESAYELKMIMDQLYELSDQAKQIIKSEFPSEYSRLDAYGALDFGTSSNPYDVTFEKALEDLEMYQDDDGDMMQEDLDLGHQDNEPGMLKGDLYKIGKYSMELYKMMDNLENMGGEIDFPHWWQSKIITAKNMISSAKHYLDFELKEPAIDAMVGSTELEEELFTPNEMSAEEVGKESASGAFEENLDREAKIDALQRLKRGEIDTLPSEEEAKAALVKRVLDKLSK